MDFQKLLILSALSSVMLLVGCGSDDESSSTFGASYTGKTANLELTETNKDLVSVEMQAAVKAITFVNYQVETQDYELKYDASIESGHLIAKLLEATSEEIESTFGQSSFPSFPYDGTCASGGVATISGSAANLSISANSYCVETAVGYMTLSGDYKYVLSGESNYVVTLQDSVIDFDFPDGYGTDAHMEANGIIEYKVTQDSTEFTVDSTLTINGISASSNVTQTCPITEGSCVIDADVVSENGNTYRVEDLSVSLSNGYSGSADFYLPKLGMVEGDFNNIQYCEDGSIGGGAIYLSENNGPAELHMFFSKGCGEGAAVNFYEVGAPR